MIRRAKAPSAGSNSGRSGRPGQVGLGDVAIRVSSAGGDGSGAPSQRRSRLRRAIATVFAALTAAAALLGGSVLSTASAAEACPNEQLRTENNSRSLADCRAYEQVTPPKKHGQSWAITTFSTDLEAESLAQFAVAEGGGRIYLPTATIAGESTPRALIGRIPSLIDRKATGWVDTAFSPAPVGPPVTPFSVRPVLYGPKGWTPNLTALDFYAPFELTARDQDNSLLFGDHYLYRPYSVDDAVELVSCPPPPALPCSASASVPVGTNWNLLSPDGSLALFETPEQFLDQEGDPLFPAASGTQIYGHRENALEWLSRPLDEPVPPGATQLSGSPSYSNTASGSQGAGEENPNSAAAVGAWQNGISTDGSRAFFASPTSEEEVPSRVYVRVDDQRTFEVSRVRGGEGTAGQKVKFRGASADGNQALITTGQALLPASGSGLSAAETDPNSVEDLYLWSLNSATDDDENTLTRLSGLEQVDSGPSPNGQVGLSVAGASDDLSHVYFTTRTTSTPFEGNLYVADLPARDPAGGTVRWIGTYFSSTEAPEPFTNSSYTGCLNAESGKQTCARTTTDGHYLAFASELPLAPEDIDSSSDIYLYNWQTGALQLASRGESAAYGNESQPATLGSTDGFFSSGPAQHVGSEGQTFFVTNEQLVAGDVNEKQDVYEYEPDGVGACHVAEGCISLVSGGVGANSSVYLGMSADGADVFFLTASGLVPNDTDGGVDAYDARVGGGFAMTQPLGCDGSGGGCQGLGTPAPQQVGAGTASFVGPGNQAHKQKSKKKKSKKKSNKKKKSKKHHAKQSRTSHHRRASR